jgi:hypothetical protein
VPSLTVVITGPAVLAGALARMLDADGLQPAWTPPHPSPPRDLVVTIRIRVTGERWRVEEALERFRSHFVDATVELAD